MSRPVCEAARSAPADAVAERGRALRQRVLRASPTLRQWWLGLPALAGCGSLPRSVGVRCSPPQPPRQTGGLDLCSRHQHASSGHSACFVIRVTQLCQIRQVLHQLARDARLVALATTRTFPDSRLVGTASMYLCQVASQCRKRAFPAATARWSRLELASVCLQATC